MNYSSKTLFVEVVRECFRKNNSLQCTKCIHIMQIKCDHICIYDLLYVCTYRTVQNFDGGNIDEFDEFSAIRQYFPYQNFPIG